MAAGTIRYCTPEGGHAQAGRVWVFTARDGLLYRTVPVTDEDEGGALYAAGGDGLGI